MSTHDRVQELREIAEEILNFDGQSDVEEHLAGGDLSLAEIYLLGALDSLVHAEKIGEERARILYAQLNIDPDRAAARRRDNNSFS